MQFIKYCTLAIFGFISIAAVNYNYNPPAQNNPVQYQQPQNYNQGYNPGYQGDMQQGQMQQQQPIVPNNQRNQRNQNPSAPPEINEKPDNATIYTPEFSREVEAAEKHRLSQTVTIDWDALEKIEPNSSFFVQKAKTADFKCLFPKNGTYTLFIPTNEAFKAMTKEMQDSVFIDPKKACMFLSYHIVYGKVTPSKVFTTYTKTTNGNKLKLRYDGKDLMVNDAKVLKTDLLSPTNISIHMIDKVLVP